MGQRRRPTKTTIDPSTFDSHDTEGRIMMSGQDAPISPEALTSLLHHFVDMLPEPQRSAVQMTTLKGMSFEEAAEMLDQPPESGGIGRRVDKKQVWNWNQQGLRRLRSWLAASPWASVMTDGRVPLGEESIGGGPIEVIPFDDVLARESATDDDGHE